jgi:ubiquinone/menaquinone biosynthesis C-methylase UbiE
MLLGNQKQVELWDKRAKFQDQTHYSGLKAKYFEELSLKKITEIVDFQDRLVLDIGCGTGWMTLKLAPKTKKIIGIDFSQEMIRRAKEKLNGSFQNVSFKVMDGRNLRFEKETFDIVLAVGTFGLTKDLTPFFKEARRVLKKGGAFIFTCYNKNLFSKLFLFKRKSVFPKIYFSERQIKEMLKKYKFEIKDIKSFYFLLPPIVWGVNYCLPSLAMKNIWISSIIKLDKYLSSQKISKNKGGTLLFCALKR